MVYEECNMRHAVFSPGWQRIRHIKRDRIRFLFFPKLFFTLYFQYNNKPLEQKNAQLEVCFQALKII